VTSRRTPPKDPQPPSSTAREEGGTDRSAQQAAPTLINRGAEIARALLDKLKGNTPNPLKAPAPGPQQQRGPRALGELLDGARKVPAASPGPLTSEVLTQDELWPLEVRRQLEEEKAKRATQVRQHKKKREKDDKRERAKEELRQLREKLVKLPRGPNLQPSKRRRADLDVQWEDLAPYLPEGWGAMWPEECQRMGARMGVPPSAVPLMELCGWIYGVRTPRSGRHSAGTAGSLCASPEELAPFLGVHVSTAKHLINVLDPYAGHRRAKQWHGIKSAIAISHKRAAPPAPDKPTNCGTVYVKRQPRIALYSDLQRDKPSAQRLPKWMDTEGKLHDWVTLRGVFYPTVSLLRTLNRRAHRKHRPKPGRTPKLRRSPMREELYRLLAPAYRILKNRLAPRPAKEATPNNVQPSLTRYIGRPRRSAFDDRPEAQNWSAGPDPP
jgi:hypothetical protein